MNPTGFQRARIVLSALLAASVFAQFVAAQEAPNPKINEFSASTTGLDVEFVEVLGAPGGDYTGYSILEIGGNGGGAGLVNELIPLGVADSAGFYLAELAPNALVNSSLSLLLVEGFSGAVGDDLDVDNDGILDLEPWTAIVDSVAISDGDAVDLFYSAVVLGPNYDGLSAFPPGGASRIPDGHDTRAPSDWARNDFDLGGLPGFPGSLSPGEALNTPGAPNQIYVEPAEGCEYPFTPIYEVQGGGASSPLEGATVSVEGVVVGDFQNNGMPDHGDLNGFFLQDPLGDGDADTSDGIFVFAPEGIDVTAGGRVRVRGAVSEFNGLTEITASQIWICSAEEAITPAIVGLPVERVEDLERFEGMLVTLPQDLAISEYFNFDRFGEIVLSTDRQPTPTAIVAPGPEAFALAEEQARHRITLDDGRSSQNPNPAIHPNGGVFDLENRFRGGDVVRNVTGILHYAFGLYRIQPTQGADYFPLNPRPEAPTPVGGTLKVASFNVLNYFTTLDSRGANTAEEFERQRAKIIAALAAIDADVVGLIEIENNTAAVVDLTHALNEALGALVYNYLHAGAIGGDEIKVAFIYKPATVSLLGGYAILDGSVDPRFLDTLNRPALAQTFIESATGGIFTAVVNHLKSKGSACDDVGDPDTGDGQGNCNLTRTAAALALVDWLATDPTGSGDTDFLILGDLNAYDKEDPIRAIVAGSDGVESTGDDYTDLIRLFEGELAYSYVFDGKLGYLDHALASTGLAGEVTGLTVWHINADEPDLIDYDMSFKQPPQDALYEPNAYRSSDHDPIVIGLNLAEEIPPTLPRPVATGPGRIGFDPNRRN